MQQETRWKDIRCFGCGVRGHIVRYCEIKKRTVAWEKEQERKKQERLLVAGNCFAKLEVQKMEDEKPKAEIRIGRITREETAVDVMKDCEKTLRRVRKELEIGKKQMGKRKGILAISGAKIRRSTEKTEIAGDKKVKIGEVTKEELKRIQDMTKEIEDGKMEIEESFDMAGSHG